METKKTLISRNEYCKKMQEAVATGFKSAIEEVEENYEISAIDFEGYDALNAATKRLVDINFLEETTDRHGEYMICGHWPGNFMHQFATKCGFDLTQIDGYSAYAFSDEQMAVITYCEGDVYFSPYKDKNLYEKRKQETIRFYKEQY